MSTKKKGDFGERIAEDFLTKKGFFIFTKNYYTRHGEIDIIAWDRDHNETVFIEVKTRSSVQFGWPEESVDAKKKTRWKKSAHVFLSGKHTKNTSRHRFDIISILIDKTSRKAQVYHFKNIEM